MYQTEREVTVLSKWEVKDDFSVVSWQIRGFDLLCLGIHPIQLVLGEVNGEPVWEPEVGHYDCCSPSAVHVGPFDLRCRTPVRPEHNADKKKWSKNRLQFIHPSIYSSIFPFIHSSNHSLINQLSIHSLHSFIHSLHSFFHSFTTHPSIHTIIHPLIRQLDNVHEVNVMPATLPLWRVNADSTGLVQPRSDHAPSRRAVQPGDFDSVRPGVCPVDIPSDKVKNQTFWRRNIGFCDDFHRRAVQKRSGDSVQGNIRPVNPFFFGIVGKSYSCGCVL